MLQFGAITTGVEQVKMEKDSRGQGRRSVVKGFQEPME